MTKIFVATVIQKNCLRISLLQSVGDHSKCVSATTCCLVCFGGEISYKHLENLSIGKSKPSKRRGARIKEIDDGMKIAIRTALIKDFMLTVSRNETTWS